MSTRLNEKAKSKTKVPMSLIHGLHQGSSLKYFPNPSDPHDKN